MHLEGADADPFLQTRATAAQQGAAASRQFFEAERLAQHIIGATVGPVAYIGAAAGISKTGAGAGVVFVARFFLDGPFSFLQANIQPNPPQRAIKQQRAKRRRSQPHHGQLELNEDSCVVVVAPGSIVALGSIDVVKAASLSESEMPSTRFISSLSAHGLEQFHPRPALASEVNDHKTYWKSDVGDLFVKNV